MQQRQISSQSILCIPGKWRSQSEIVTSIAGNNMGEYLFAGKVLMHLPTRQYFQVDIGNPDDRMRQSFRVAGAVNQVPEPFLDEIEAHTFVVYLIAPTGTFEGAESIARAGNAVLKAGGIGLKVETAGKAFTGAQWMDLVENFETADLYKMFVLNAIRDEEGTVFSCGMHNLGLKDTIVSGEAFGEAAGLINLFSYYQIIDRPVINNGQTFSEAAGAPIFRITEEPAQPYLGHELFENPFGMWRLARK